MTAKTIPQIPDFPPGVQFNAPPSVVVPSIMQSIEDAVSKLPPDVDAALVGVANRKSSNAAFIARTPGGFAVQAWIGKSWNTDDLDYGAAIMKTFKWGK